MTNTVEHLGIVENIYDSHLQVRIIQTSACATCSAKGHCTSVDQKEKVIDIINTSAFSFKKGEQVIVQGKLSMGMLAVAIAFVLPFFLLVSSLFVMMHFFHNELYASLFSLLLLIPYYFILWSNKSRMKQKFSFTIKPIKY